MKQLKNNFVFLIFTLFSLNLSAQISPYGTGFNVGTKEDLEIRLEWSKKDPCFDPGFTKNSKEYLELKKYRMIQGGPHGKPVVCEKKK